MMKIKSVLLSALLLGSSAVAQAHMVWLERTQNAVNAYFGEFAAGELETQESSLKKFANAAVIQQDKPLKPTAQPDHFSYATKSKADVRFSADLLHGDMLAQFRAKSGREDVKPLAELEIVPASSNSNQFVTYFQGKPLAKQEVIIFAPNKWSKTYYTNDKGEFAVETPWAGQYVIEAGKPVEEAGKYEQKEYKTRYLVATLSFNVVK